MRKTHATHRCLWALTLAFLGLTLCSYLRFRLSGALKLDDLPIHIPHEVLIRTLSALFFAISAWAFWKLWNSPEETLNLKSLLGWALAVHLVAGLSLPLTSNDIFSNLAYGQMSRLGLDPFASGPTALPLQDPFRSQVTIGWLNTPMVYGPLVGWINQLSVLSGKLPSSLALQKLLYLALGLGTVVLTFLFCRTFLPEKQKTRAFVLFALNPLFIWEISGQAHNDGLMVFLTMLFVYLVMAGRFWFGFFALCAGFFSKFAVFPVLGLFLCYVFFKNRKQAVLMALLFAGLGILYIYLFHHGEGSVLLIPLKKEINPFQLTNSLSYLVYWGFYPLGPSGQIWALRTFFLLAHAFLLALGLRFAFKTRTLPEVFEYSHWFLLFFLLIATAAFQPWYILWLLPLTLTLREKYIQKFMAVFSMTFLVSYPVTHRLVGSILIVVMLYYFLKTVRAGRGGLGRSSSTAGLQGFPAEF